MGHFEKVWMMQIATGMDFSLAVEIGSGRLFSFGDDSLGQLGRPATQAGSQRAEDWIVRDAEGGAPSRGQGNALHPEGHQLAQDLANTTGVPWCLTGQDSTRGRSADSNEK